jgi:hypothetical protein
MWMTKILKKYYWWLPLCSYSLDANAWGLVTHLYFAQSLLWAMPLLDHRLQNAIKRFPDLVMAGACLPDLAIVSARYQQTHMWEYAHDLLDAADTDEEIAIAIGFASHLYIDVIAHNHFVPAHEAMWFNNPWLKSKHKAHSFITHIASEWAMDAHLAPLVNTSPRQLLNMHHTTIVQFISPHFRCPEHHTSKALNRLAFWDSVLRVVKLPHAIYKLAHIFDQRIFTHFVYYIAKTQVAIETIGIALNGQKPMYHPELKNLSVQQLDHWRLQCLNHLHLLHPEPITYFSEKSAAKV